MRRLTVHDCGGESPKDTFSRDHVALCRVARSDDTAILRVWHAAAEGVSVGRFHRRAAGDSPLVRRLSGGRAVAVGPGIVSLTGVYPSMGWLSFGRETPGPDQVLNRGLRPLLAALRSAGVDAFYGGRDLVTWEARPIALASFTVLPDGVVVVEAHVAVSTGLDRCAALLAEADPGGLVLHDAASFLQASALDRRLPRVGTLDWAACVADHAATTFGCDVRVTRGIEDSSIATAVAPAFTAFQNERTAIPTGWFTAVGIEMLGAIEAAARIESGRISALELSGDLIAPYATVAEIEEACVGQPPSRPAAERALFSVLSRPGRFLLGVRDLGGLIERLA